MFVLGSSITIDEYQNIKPHEVKIKKGVYSFVDKALIKVPIRVGIPQRYGKEDTLQPASTFFKEGMAVTINLGYNGQNVKEFKGFINRINATSPCEISCEGYSYQLKNQTYQQTFKNTTLIAILKYLIIGTDIILSNKIPDIPIVKFLCRNESGTEILNKLIKTCVDAISFRFDDNILIAEVFPLNPDTGTLQYQMGWNVIRGDDLKKADPINMDVEVNIIGEVKDGTKVQVQTKTRKYTKDNVIKTVGQAGTTGEKKVYITHAITDPNALTMLSGSKLNRLTFAGYTGNITAFLQPFCACGYKVILTDKRYPERSGNYIVDSIEVTYGMSGARRIVGLLQI